MAKIGRFYLGGRVFYGLLEGSGVLEIDSPFKDIRPSGKIHNIGDLRTLAPCLPGKVVCVGLNYREHAREVGMELPAEPVLFFKPSTALIGPGDYIEYPEVSRRVDYEAELAVIIGSRCRNASPGDARRHVLGYTCANDVTARDLQKKDGQWARSKSFDTFLPLGPYIITGIDPHRLDISLYLNGRQKQKSNTADLVFNVDELVSFISGIMTLNPGDVVLTGTPSGIGAMERGDRVEVVIDTVGVLANTVK